MKRAMPIDLLLPELFASEGGIQVYSRTLLKALRRIRPEQPLRVFIHNDFPHHLPRSGWPGIAWHPCRRSSVGMAAALLRAARRRRPRLLLSTHANFALLQLLHHRLTGTPSWCSAHGIEVWSLGAGPKRWGLRRLQRLLPVSHFTAERLRQQLGAGCPPQGLLANSFDRQRFSPGPRPQALLARYGLRPDQPLIFTISRLNRFDRYKNIDALIEALPPLLQRWPDLRLMVAGTGDDQPRLQQRAEVLQLEREVIFPGRITEAELPDHYRLATLFALPSEREGFGIVFLEALGCGLPVLAGNRDGSVDPLGSGRLGLLVDPHLPLAPALASLLARQGDALWFQAEVLAREAAQRFGFEAFCAQLDAQLQELNL